MHEQDSVTLSTRVPRELATRFEKRIRQRGFMNTSDALRALIRAFVEEVEKG